MQATWARQLIAMDSVFVHHAPDPRVEKRGSTATSFALSRQLAEAQKLALRCAIPQGFPSLINLSCTTSADGPKRRAGLRRAASRHPDEDAKARPAWRDPANFA